MTILKHPKHPKHTGAKNSKQTKIKPYNPRKDPNVSRDAKYHTQKDFNTITGQTTVSKRQ